MTLIREYDDGSLRLFNPAAERLGDGRGVPPNIEALWDDAELNAAKLYRLERFVVPPQSTRTGAARFEKSGTIVREVYDTEPAIYAAEHVKAEAQRRIIALTGKTTLQDCMIKQFNALMRAGELTDKRVSGETLTAAEEVEAETLRGLATKVKAIRTASNVIEAMSPIPADYADNRHWPAGA